MGFSEKLKIRTFFPFKGYPKVASILIFSFCFSFFFFTNCQMTTEDPLNITSRSSVVPNLLSQIQTLASQNAIAFSSSCMSWDFIDLVVEELRDHNERFGYSCEQGNCTVYSTNRIAFYTGSASTSDSADGSGEMIVVEVVDCNSSPSLTWLEKINVNGLWKLSRAGNSVASYTINPLPGSTTLNTLSSATSTTMSGSGTSEPSCVIPNKSDVVSQIASSYAQAVQDSDCGNEYQNTTWEFLDRVVESLHSSDRRWGYNCKRGDCTQPSKDAIAYYCGSGTPNSNSVSVGIIDIITGIGNNCRHQWVDVTEETKNNGTVGRWLYPRSNSSVTDTNNNNAEFTHRSVNAPNMKHIVNRLAEQCPTIMQAVWSESKKGWSGDLRFLDLTVEALRAENKRWGYTFWTRTGYADRWSVDRVGYFHGTGNPNNSTDITVIDYLAPKQKNGKWVYYPSWFDATQQLKTEYPDATGYWRYPRPGATVSLSDCGGISINTDNDISDFSWDKVTFLNGHNVSNWAITSPISSVSVSRRGICIHHPKNGQWPAKKLGDIQVEANHWVIVKRDDRYYAATYEWIRKGGQTCKLVNSLSQIYIELGGGQINKSPLDSSWVPKGGDVVGFMVSGLARHNFNPNVRERSNIVWYRLPSVDGSISGQMLGSYGSNESSTSSNGTSEESFKTICTPEQLNNGFGSHPEKGCVPRCHTFASSNVNGVEMAEGSACDDRVNYNILEVKNIFEDKCCRRSSKSSCPMGYRSSRGNCQPTCAQAAGLAGHTQKAWHNVVGNYVLHEKQTFANDANCRELDEYGPDGYGDWRDFTFYDPYTFRRLKNDRNTIYEIIADRRDDYLCCVRGTANTKSGPTYTDDGWTLEETFRFLVQKMRQIRPQRGVTKSRK